MPGDMRHTMTYTTRRGDGQPMAGPGSTTVRGAVSSGNVWHPTVVNLLILVVVEIGAYALLRYTFRQFHGG